MARYRKLIAVVLGLGLLVGMKHFEIAIPGLQAEVLEWIVSAATAFGVYQAKNEA